MQNNKDKNEKDEKENKKQDFSEEELRKVIEQLKGNQPNSNIIKSAIFFHPNIAVHLLISLIINIFAGMTVIGLIDSWLNLVEWDITSFFITILLFTLIANVLTIIVGYFLIKKVLLWFGAIHFVLEMISFYLASLITRNNFNFGDSFWNLLLFTFSFSVMVQLLALLYRKIYRYILRKRRLKS